MDDTSAEQQEREAVQYSTVYSSELQYNTAVQYSTVQQCITVQYSCAVHHCAFRSGTDSCQGDSGGPLAVMEEGRWSK